ncbi:alpha/beta fold hydrolase [Simiduia curdlanivorans]|uniref:Alpha/beta fold hydrolase n=1 Tax=Simiduia curdlanivorans TaxID=1492769 RepID=A0ABV8V232_9GAMM|nr:alpha/beta fold hydrolase [Simiduia curdlanivorans]
MSQLFVKKIAATQSARGTLLLLHGWGFDHRCWLPLVPYLHREYNVWLLDLPGFGASARLNVDSAEAWLAQTLLLLDWQVEAAANNGPVYLLGWSLGGQLAMRLLQRHPSVKAAMCVATNLQFCANAAWPSAMPAEHFSEFLQSFLSAPDKTLNTFSRLVAAGDAEALTLRKLLPGALSRFDSQLRLNWYFALQSLQLLDHTQAEFDRPVLLLLSDQDALVPIAMAQALADKSTLRCARLTQASHGHLLIQPAWVAKALKSFLHDC